MSKSTKQFLPVVLQVRYILSKKSELVRSTPFLDFYGFYRIIFCIYLTATSSKDSLLSWVRCLEKEVPNIGNLQILFTLKQVWSPIQPISEEDFMMREYKN